MEQLLEKPTEVGKSLGFGRSTTYDLIAAGEIPSVRIRGSIRVPVDGLKAWVLRKVKERAAATATE